MLDNRCFVECSLCGKEITASFNNAKKQFRNKPPEWGMVLACSDEASCNARVKNQENSSK
jgi:hypothetical protein